MGIIVVLSISICFLIFAIASRPRYSTASETPEPAIITEANDEIPASADINQSVVLNDDIAVGTDDQSQSLQGKTSARVNIRDNPSADAKVLDTVDGGTLLDIIEVQSDGWTKINYNNSIAYISSDYVILLNE
jgi:hypothetical protein